MKALRVKAWHVHELSQGKRYKNLAWVAVPNRHDGIGFAYMIGGDDGPAIYGAWCLLLQVASKQPQRGLLLDSRRRPISAEDLEAMTRCPAKWFQLAIRRALSDRVEWLEEVEVDSESAQSDKAVAPSGAGEPTPAVHPEVADEPDTSPEHATTPSKAPAAPSVLRLTGMDTQSTLGVAPLTYERTNGSREITRAQGDEPPAVIMPPNAPLPSSGAAGWADLVVKAYPQTNYAAGGRKKATGVISTLASERFEGDLRAAGAWLLGRVQAFAGSRYAKTCPPKFLKALVNWLDSGGYDDDVTAWAREWSAAAERKSATQRVRYGPNN